MERATLPEIPFALTFDDVLLEPQASSVLPSDVDVSTQLARDIRLNIPLLSSAMDTVTESRLAIAMAREGGIGFIHKNMSIVDQASEVALVKKSESGLILDPVTIAPSATVQDAISLMEKHNISGIPVVEENRRLVGIVTRRDIRFRGDKHMAIATVMTKDVITAKQGISLEDAKVLMLAHRVEKLPVISADGMLRGLVTIKDIEKREIYPHATKDTLGRLRVGAAVGVGADRAERMAALIQAGVDIIVIDTAHGHSQAVIDAVKAARREYPDLALVAGNVATPEATEALLKAGADTVKVGVGPGSICTTRIVAGVGVPQFTAVQRCAAVAKRLGGLVISDGGIRHSGDVVKALAAGAASVMIGSLLAGTDEAPGELVLYQGRSFKTYRGMGSLGAMQAGSADRYFQGKIASDGGKFVPEGVEGMVPHRGSLSASVYQLVGGLRSGMGYVGACNLDALFARARFVRVTAAGMHESHVHDITVTNEAPNYSRS